MTEQDKVLQYSDSGVNYDLMDPFKIACQRAAITTAGNIKRFAEYGLYVEEITESRGESAYEIEIISLNSRALRLAIVEEGLGTKNIIADQMRELQQKINLADTVKQILGKSFYKGIGIDNAAMILNDLATRGASPLSFMLHVAAYPSSWFADEERANDIADGTVEACNQSRCSWGGGESPALRDIINPGYSLLSGSAIGLEFSMRGFLSERNLEPGDQIILALSSGLHANGITLTRTSLLEKLPKGYETHLSNGQTYGEVILTPTILYPRLVDGLLDKGIPLHYATHISGHGWRKLMRAQKEFTYVIDKIPEPQPIFQYIKDLSGMDNEQIYGDYNMGAGFALFVKNGLAQTTVDLANQLGYETLHAGYVETGPRRVVINPVGVEFKGDTLQIR